MKFETMGYRNLENPQRRTETNEYSDTFRDLLLPGEKWDDLTWEEQGERIDAYRDGTIEELLEKKLEEREKDTSVEDALRTLRELDKQMGWNESDKSSNSFETREERLSESQKAMMELEKTLERMKEKVYGKQNIEQKVVNGEFVEIPDDKMVSIQERKNEKMIRELPSKEPSKSEILVNTPISQVSSSNIPVQSNNSIQTNFPIQSNNSIQSSTEEKEMYITMQQLAKQNKELMVENEQFRMMIAKLQGMENNPNQPSK